MAEPVTVACVFVKGEYPYTVEYVVRLRNMVDKWIGRPYRFFCLTDQPWAIPEGIESVPVRKLHGFAPWSKLHLFDPARQWSGRVLYLDLDTLIVSSLAPILDAPSSFAITADPHNAKNRTRDSFGRAIVRRFNSSVMVWDGGTHTELFTDWTPAVSARLSGDQDWIGEQLPMAHAMPRAWFPRISEAQPPWSEDAKVVLVKVPKNADAARRWAWFDQAWGAA